MAFLADRPSVHLWRDITERRDFADLVKVLAHRRLQRTSRDGRHECLRNLLDRSSLPHFMLHRNIGAELRYSRDASANLFMYLLHLLTAPSPCATLRALALRVASYVSAEAAGGGTCLPGGGCRGWDRQHYHHDHRRRDRRLAGRKHRAGFWFRTALERHHRNHRRVHRRLATYALGLPAVLWLHRLDRQCHDWRGHTFGDRRGPPTLGRRTPFARYAREVAPEILP